ncbi:MAG: hypothetical protein IIA91_03335 [Chloroflexi bacterium]|nr:hypothetical protein [Chloroflexota bacterium]
MGDRTVRLRPYETVRRDGGESQRVRAVESPALGLSLSIPPLDGGRSSGQTHRCGGASLNRVQEPI